MTINVPMKRHPLSLKKLIRLFIARQYLKEADTVVIIYGLPRTGKTVLGFKMLLHYLYYMRKLNAMKKSDWNPGESWKTLFKNYFATTSGDMAKKVRHNPDRSFTFIDEGVDVVSWHQALESEQKDLIELLQKTGKKKMFTIIITPSLSLLTKQILARARYMFILTREPEKGRKFGNRAIVLKNSNNPIIAENNPFGIAKILKDLKKFPFMSETRNFESYLSKRREYIGAVHYGNIRPNLYALYDVMIKEPSILKEREKRSMVTRERFMNMQYALQNIIYNLKTRDLKTIRQIRSLLTDKFGNELVSEAVIRKYIDKITVMEQRQDRDVEDELMPKIKDESEVEDLKVGEDTSTVETEVPESDDEPGDDSDGETDDL